MFILQWDKDLLTFLCLPLHPGSDVALIRPLPLYLEHNRCSKEMHGMEDQEGSVGLE